MLTVVQDHPATVRSQIVGEAALELLSLEDRFGPVGELVEVLSNFGAFGVGHWVDSNLDFVYEVEEGLQEGPCQVLISDLFPHIYL